MFFSLNHKGPSQGKANSTPLQHLQLLCPRNLLDCNCIQIRVDHPYKVADRMQLASCIVVSHYSRIFSSVFLT